jgi:hypothetical protein
MKPFRNITTICFYHRPRSFVVGDLFINIFPKLTNIRIINAKYSGNRPDSDAVKIMMNLYINIFTSSINNKTLYCHQLEHIDLDCSVLDNWNEEMFPVYTIHNCINIEQIRLVLTLPLHYTMCVNTIERLQKSCNDHS